MDPEAMRFPVGSNLAEKISPECPDSSITGACSALVLGVYDNQFPSHYSCGLIHIRIAPMRSTQRHLRGRVLSHPGLAA